MGSAGTGHHADIDFRLSELGGFARDDHIAEHAQFATAAQCKSAHSCNDWLAGFADGVPGTELIDLQHINRAFSGHLFDICTCRKSAFVAGDHDGAHCGIFIKGFQCVAYFAHQLQIEGIEFFRAVEAYQGNIRCHLRIGEDVFKGHAAKLGKAG